MRKLVVGTRNAGKIREIKASLAELSVEVVGLPDTEIPEVEETGVTFAENAVIKARYYSHHTGEYCLADDSGLEVDALEGEPGVYSARYAGEGASDEDNNQKLLKALAGVPEKKRSARFRSVLALAGPEGSILLTDGVCEGLILTQGRGAGGFGYDPLFYMPDYQKTLAEMSVEEKNKISHRGNALASFKQKLIQEKRLG